jgi:hypothetical protein
VDDNRNRHHQSKDPADRTETVTEKGQHVRSKHQAGGQGQRGCVNVMHEIQNAVLNIKVIGILSKIDVMSSDKPNSYTGDPSIL